MASKTVYLRHESGRNDALSGKRLAKLLRELKEGRGATEVTALVAAGYESTMGGLDVASLEFEALYAEASGRFDHA